MTDNRDQNEQVHIMSEKFENISTSDSDLKELNRSLRNEPTTPKSTSFRSPSPASSPKKYGTPPFPDELTKLNNPMKSIPEKIIFIIDTVKEMDSTKFEISSGIKNYSSLTMIKHAVEIFINAKNSINCNHEFALMTLSQNSADWILDFTDDKKTFINHLEKIEEVYQEKIIPGFDISNCFSTILDNINLDKPFAPPNYLIRTIMIYSRSQSEPCFSSNYAPFEKLNGHPYFYLDMLYVHETPTEKNACEDIYKALVSLDIKSKSYIFEVGRNATILHNHMAKLLAHPLQRPKQEDTCYEIFFADIGEQDSDI